jgi:hypothetical protein
MSAQGQRVLGLIARWRDGRLSDGGLYRRLAALQMLRERERGRERGRTLRGGTGEMV